MKCVKCGQALKLEVGVSEEAPEIDVWLNHFKIFKIKIGDIARLYVWWPYVLFTRKYCLLWTPRPSWDFLNRLASVVVLNVCVNVSVSGGSAFSLQTVIATATVELKTNRWHKMHKCKFPVFLTSVGIRAKWNDWPQIADREMAPVCLSVTANAEFFCQGLLKLHLDGQKTLLLLVLGGPSSCMLCPGSPLPLR